MTPHRVAILGFGFSGLMTVANLVRDAKAPATLYIIAPEATGLGLAYGTTDADHLLNVAAGKMGAFADAIDGFAAWLTTEEAAQHKAQLGLTADYAATDFVPRMLYGAYLQTIWHDTQHLAAERHIHLKLVPSMATGILAGAPWTVQTERGDAIAVDSIVLATGHETKPIMPQLGDDHVIQNPWQAGAFDDAAHWASPVVLMGTGLTAIDTIMTLRNRGYHGEIIAFSRHGFLPQPHQSNTTAFAFDPTALLAQPSLARLMRYVRTAIASQPDWRAVVDALRPHTITLWQSLTEADQKRFLTRLLSFWSVHRHRMSPVIAARIQQEINAGTVRIVASNGFHAERTDKGVQLTLHPHHQEALTLNPSRIINCTGPEMNITRSRQPLLQHAVANRLLEPHATGLGVAADPYGRAWGPAYGALYVVGPLLTGQWLESTAVPELRVQAARVAEHLSRRL